MIAWILPSRMTCNTKFSPNWHEQHVFLPPIQSFFYEPLGSKKKSKYKREKARSTVKGEMTMEQRVWMRKKKQKKWLQNSYRIFVSDLRRLYGYISYESVNFTFKQQTAAIFCMYVINPLVLNLLSNLHLSRHAFFHVFFVRSCNNNNIHIFAIVYSHLFLSLCL